MAVKKDTKTNKWYFYGKYINILGEEKQYKKRGFSTKSEAKKQEQLFLLSKKETTGKSIDELFEELTIFSEGRKKTSTINKDKDIYRLHIQPYFADKNYQKITVQSIIKWQQYLLKEKNLTASRINQVMKTFNKLYTHAHRVYGYSKNPISIVGRLKEAKREYITWNEEDFYSFFNVLEKQRDKVAFRLLYFTGIRRGEFLALQWNDYNGKSINICKTCSHVKGSYMITDPKTRNSYRLVELDNTTNAMIKEWKKEMEQYDGFDETWFIFGTNKPMSFNELGRKKDKYIPIANVPQIRIHDLRHSHVSMLINNNIPLPAIANRVGDTIDTILKTYSHLFDKSNKELMDLLNKS